MGIVFDDQRRCIGELMLNSCQIGRETKIVDGEQGLRRRQLLVRCNLEVIVNMVKKRNRIDGSQRRQDISTNEVWNQYRVARLNPRHPKCSNESMARVGVIEAVHD
jgi:hypothetical protein